MRKTALLFATIIALTFCIPAFAQSIKMATLAPKGSAWMQVMKMMNNRIKKRTDGKVKFKIYPGGIKGDEQAVLKRMKRNTIHAAGFLGPGLGEIVPEIRILETPFLYRNSEEVDYVRNNLKDYFEQRFREEGFVLLGWGEAGLVYVFSNKPIRKVSDLEGIKMWALEGDVLASSLADVFNFKPTYLQLPDVLTSLQTGLIDAFYAPPLAAVALQWYTKVQYMTNMVVSNSTGALLITKKQFDKVSPENQKILLEEGMRAGQELISNARKGNAEALAEMKVKGIKVVEVDQKELERMEQVAKKVRVRLTGKLYSKDLVEKVEKLLADYRAGKKS